MKGQIMGHIHAAAMAEYAKDAIEDDMPWERWEVSYPDSDRFRNLLGNPDWATNRKYRRKPKVILINGHEVPEPCRTPLEDGKYYWIPDLIKGAVQKRWRDNDEDSTYLEDGFVHLTREAAEKHFNALKSFTAKDEQ